MLRVEWRLGAMYECEDGFGALVFDGQAWVTCDWLTESLRTGQT
jgi:hypothetical protein